MGNYSLSSEQERYAVDDSWVALEIYYVLVAHRAPSLFSALVPPMTQLPENKVTDSSSADQPPQSEVNKEAPLLEASAKIARLVQISEEGSCSLVQIVF